MSLRIDRLCVCMRVCEYVSQWMEFFQSLYLCPCLWYSPVFLIFWGFWEGKLILLNSNQIIVSHWVKWAFLAPQRNYNTLHYNSLLPGRSKRTGCQYRARLSHIYMYACVCECVCLCVIVIVATGRQGALCYSCWRPNYCSRLVFTEAGYTLTVCPWKLYSVMLFPLFMKMIIFCSFH